jgi:N-acetylmuramoyl-L-alanine amidase
LLLQVAEHLAGQGGSTPLTLLSRDGRRSIATHQVNGREFVALDELASTFQLTVREESGALTVSYRGRTIVLTPDQALASVSGRLISLPSAPARAAGRWLVPVEFISRALAPIYEAKLDLRAASHLLIVGDLRIPRIAIRHEVLGNSARVTLDATPAAASTVVHENNRLAIRFEADAVDAAIPPITITGVPPIVQAIRIADPTTVSIELGPRFASFRASSQTLDGNIARLVVDLLAPTPAETAAPPPPAAPPADLPLFGQQTAALRTIVIDPGHGGNDLGTKGPAGTLEKDVTLAVARRMKAALEASLGARVLLTRDDDSLVALDDRTAVANNNKADLFLSLHVNASLRPGATGASIYVASFSDVDRSEATLVPARVPIFGGGSRDIELVPWDLAQIRYVEQSTELARILQRELENRVPLDARAIDRAPFRVLESANMPAALIEIGYLTNPDQEKQMAGAGFQTVFVQALSNGVLRFRDHLVASNGADR